MLFRFGLLELYVIYLNVSALSDQDKMKATVDSIIDYKSKAIFPHLSRIKSEFYKVMDKNLAEDFIVSWQGLKNRCVQLDANRLILSRHLQDVFSYIDTNY